MLDTFRGSVLNDCGEPVVDLSARFLQLSWIVIFGGVELSAVATVVAIANSGDLVELLLGHARSSPLPWVFTSVGEEDISA